jgi:HK97 family phage portal protein
VGLFQNVREYFQKANPAQLVIHQEAGTYQQTIGTTINYLASFQQLETVNRGVSMIVEGAASMDYDVKDSVGEAVVPGMRKKQLQTLLNFRPNPYQSAQDFRQNIFTDLILEGNVFIYFDGAFLYHLPAAKVTIVTDEKTFIKGYKYAGFLDLKVGEVFSFKDVSNSSIYRGVSRLQSAIGSIRTLVSMQELQENFFNNGAMFGTVFTTDNTLSQVAKDKTIANWMQKYNPKQGGRRPVILDSGLKPFPVAQTSFQEMDFDSAMKTHSSRVLQALGVPPILLDGGNNANISPNLRLFYLETVLPITRKFSSALERYFGYDIEAITSTVSALQPELKDIAAYHATLVNGGIITPNEARQELRYDKKADGDELRVPANIAGSAANPSIGGRPPEKPQGGDNSG